MTTSPDQDLRDAAVAAFCAAYNAHFDTPAVEPYDKETLDGVDAVIRETARVLAKRLREEGRRRAVHWRAAETIERLCGLDG